jgi:hypothetical protein
METANDAEWLRASEQKCKETQSGHGLKAVGPLSQESFPRPARGSRFLLVKE